jgi:hypothetical protein
MLVWLLRERLRVRAQSLVLAVLVPLTPLMVGLPLPLVSPLPVLLVALE